MESDAPAPNQETPTGAVGMPVALHATRDPIDSSVLADIRPKSWSRGIATVYIALFLWIAYFDQIGRRPLAIGGLGWPMLGALVGGLACYLLLFRGPALWGFSTKKPLPELLQSTLGERGANRLFNVVTLLAQLVWVSVAVDYAATTILDGLTLIKLLDPIHVHAASRGAYGIAVRSPIYLFSALSWCLLASLISSVVIRWIAALLQVFPVFPAAIVGVAMVWNLNGLRGFLPSGIDPSTGLAVPIREGAIQSFLLMIQWILGFGAMACASGADWGVVTKSREDVAKGGLVGISGAATVIAILAILSVAGHEGARNVALETDPFAASATPGARTSVSEIPIADSSSLGGSPLGGPGTFLRTLHEGFGPWAACLMMMALGVGSLSPAAYGTFLAGHRLVDLLPGRSRIWLTIGAGVLAWPLIAIGWSARVESIATIMGAVFASLIGAMTADAASQGWAWKGSRPGWHRAGIVAWGLGTLVGLSPLFTPLQPGAFWAFAVGFAAFRLAARPATAVAA